jgi:hypothetical protein
VIREEFWVQWKPKDPWHRESDEDCERMLCGARIQADLGKVQTAPGARICPDCWIETEKRRRVAAMAT